MLPTRYFIYNIFFFNVFYKCILNFFKNNNQNKIIKEILINITSNLFATDYKDILIISNTLAFLTSNPTELSLNSAVTFICCLFLNLFIDLN
jgi:hypothetical protein